MEGPEVNRLLRGRFFYGVKYEGAVLVSLERLYEVGTFNWTSLGVIVSLVS